MPRKTGLIISWNWTRGYGIVQEQDVSVYTKGDKVMVMTKDMEAFEDAVIMENTNTQTKQIKIKFSTSNREQIVDHCCIREQPIDSGKQLFVHNQSCDPKEYPAKGFIEPIGQGRVWFSLWERVYYDEGPNNSAVNVSHKM